MLLPFLHQRLRALELLLARSSEVLAKYNDRDLDLAPALVQYLDEAVAGYHALALASTENELLVLKGEFVSAGEGVHPLTLERATSRRREMMRSIALRVLQRSAERLRADIERDNAVLAGATVQLRPLVLAAMQKGLLQRRPGRPGRPRQAETQAAPVQTERLWQAMLADPELHLAARQVAMQVSGYDIQLLLDDLIDAAGWPR